MLRYSNSASGLQKVAIGLFTLTFALSLSSCRPSASSDSVNPTVISFEMENSSKLSIFVDGAAKLTGSPNLYELKFVFPNQESKSIHRRGDLPAEAGLVHEGSLPSGSGVVLTADLFRDQYLPSTQTHSCRAIANETLALIRQTTSSMTLVCYPMVNPGAAEPAEVFIAVAAIDLNLEEGNIIERLAERDWSKLSLFSQFDREGRRISLRGNANHIFAHLGGEISFSITSGEPQSQLLKDLVSGTPLTLAPVFGRRIQAIQSNAVLQLDGSVLMLQGSSGQVPRFVLPVKLSTTDGSTIMKASLVEEPASNEFTIVTYNGENLFDQTDEDRNSGYGDYRISPNLAGASSNFGQPVVFEGTSMSFSEVKLRGLKKALTGIDPLGPEVVAIEEVESEQVMQQLLTVTQDLGYVTSEFSGWIPGEVPNAIGTGILSKYPIKSRALLSVPYPPNVVTRDEPIRPIFKVVLNVTGKNVTLYINHWRSQAGPESLRKAAAEVIQADLTIELAANPALDYLILGDLNSAYNEARTMEPEHNDTGGTSGINSVLQAQGDEALMLGATPAKFNFHYELNAFDRKSHYDTRYGWACFDHLIGGNGLYDMRGITYVDNSFTVPSQFNPTLSFLLDSNGDTIRWKSKRQGLVTTHQVGGYSDHLPVFARFFIPKRQTDNKINLVDPAKPDALDSSASP